jgi:hypothetical protein
MMNTGKRSFHQSGDKSAKANQTGGLSILMMYLGFKLTHYPNQPGMPIPAAPCYTYKLRELL